MEKTKRQIAREKAIIGVYQYLLVGSSFDDIYNFLNEDKILSENEDCMSFSKWLVKTTIDNIDSYKALLQKYLKTGWTFERIGTMEQAILLIATCEILDSDLSERVVINEAVINAKEYCDASSYKFINGVLHKLL